MAIFPIEIPVIAPEMFGLQWRTLRREAENGDIQRRGKWLFPRYIYNLQVAGLDQADAMRLWDFYSDRRGSLELFYFLTPLERSFSGQYVATGDGVTSVFVFPARLSSSVSVYVNGVLQAEPSDITFSPGAGPDGLDQLSFVAAPAAGAYVTADFTGQLVLRCFFAEDNYTPSTLACKLTSGGVPLTGVRFDA